MLMRTHKRIQPCCLIKHQPHQPEPLPDLSENPELTPTKTPTTELQTNPYLTKDATEDNDFASHITTTYTLVGLVAILFAFMQIKRI